MSKAPTKAKPAGKPPANKAKGSARKAPAPSNVASLRARVKELEQDKRLLRDALDAMERKYLAATRGK